MDSLETVAKEPSRVAVGLVSLHPLLASECQRLLSRKEFRLLAKKSEPRGDGQSDALAIPRATVYVVEAQATRHATHGLVGTIRQRYPKARILMISDKFGEASAFPLLRLGVKGLLRYGEVSTSLDRAVHALAGGGFWVPRSLLSKFVDTTLDGSRRPRFDGGVHLSRREREVAALLLENLSNKEIASKLHMSERTAKFHVSNLLSKYGVKRRADLILLSFGQNQAS
jgi:DNA-binding NarL/FixJ family response regulator